MGDKITEIKVQFAGSSTVRELESLRRATTNLRKDEVIGTKQYLELAKQESQIKDKLYKANIQAYSTNAKMKESYFNLGQQLRANKFAVQQLAEASGMDRGGLGAVLMGFTGPGGIMAGLTAGFGLFANMVKTAVEDLTNAKKALLEFDRAAKRSALQAELRRVQSGGSWLDQIPGGETLLNIGLAGALPGYAGGLMGAADKAKNLLREKQIKAELAKMDQEDLDTTKKKNDEEVKRLKLLDDQKDARDLALGFYGPARPTRRGAGAEYLTTRGFTGYSPNEIDSQDRQFQLSHGMDMGHTATTPDKEKKSLTDFETRAIRVGDTMRSSLSNAFVAAFGLGNSLLDQFASSVLAELGDFLISSIFGSISGAVGAAFNPIGAVGGAVAGAVSGRPGGGKSYGSRSSSSPMVLGVKLGLTDLAIGVERGNRLRSPSVMR